MAIVVDVDRPLCGQLLLLLLARLAPFVSDQTARLHDHPDDLSRDAWLRGPGGVRAHLRPLLRLVDRAGYGSAFVLTAAVAAFGAVWWAFGVPRIEQVKLDEMV